jgi:carbon-monoxide dehydrogenase medium subunit
MVKFNPTILERPTTIKEATSLLGKYGGQGRVVAGNTTLHELAYEGGLADVDTLIDVMNLGLSYVTGDDQVLRVGAATVFNEIGSSILLDGTSWYALKEVSLKLTPPQIRNMATVGGSVCCGIPFYDLPVTLLALDTNFKVASSSSGERLIKAEDFFVDYFVTALSAEDLLVELQIPKKANTGSSFVKLGRTSVDFAVVNTAVTISLDEKTRQISEARVALGAVAAIPIRVKRVEESLIGKEPSEKSLAKASSLAVAEGFEPSPSVHASSEYKKRVIPVIVREALSAASRRAEEATYQK